MQMRTIGRVLLSCAALLAFIGGTHAADMATGMATKMPVKAPVVPAPAYDWSGFYLGGYYGGSLSQSNASTPKAETGSVDLNSSSTTVGITAGYNLQLSPLWLVGIEGDFGYLGGGQLFADWDDNADAGANNRWYATLRGRAGYITGPSLIYVTGGVGFVHVTDAFGGNDIPPLASPVSSSTTTTGGALARASKPNCHAIGRRRPNISILMAAAIIHFCPTRLDRPRRRRPLSRTASR
jgi:outer membrane immunogenic protein